MSLINQMLQDLDARKAAQGAGSGLPNDVRPLPKVRASRLPLVLGSLVALIAVVALAAYLFLLNGKAARQDTPPAPIAVIEASPPLPVPPVPEAVVPPASQVAETVSPEPASVVESELQALDGSLRMADVLEFPVEKKLDRKTARPGSSSGKTPASDGQNAKETGKPELLTPSPATTDAVSPAVGKGQTQPTIEKTEATGSPRDRAESEYRKAIAAVNQGRVDEALTGLRNALQQDHFHQASRQLLVKLLLEAKRTDEAVQVLQDGVQTQPAQIAWAMSLARLQVDRGDLAGAWQTLNYSQPAALGNADYQGFSGHVLQRLGRHKEAIERYLAAARLSPNDGRWWLGLGLSLEAEGQISEAKEAFQKARSTGTLNAELSTLIDQKLR